MMRVRFAFDSGKKLAVSVERLADDMFLDFADGTFKATPATPTQTLPEDAMPYLGRYRSNIPTAGWTNGDYVVTVHDAAEMAADVENVVALLGATIYNGDDATVFPAPLMPGQYPVTFGPVTITVPAAASH